MVKNGVRFGKWHPITEAETTALEEPGVLQARAEGAMDYRSGCSAMVLYACSDASETLRGYVAGRGSRDLDRAISAGARWIRFAPTPDPRRELDRLLEGFTERFGSPPISNSNPPRRVQTPAAQRATAKGEEDPR